LPFHEKSPAARKFIILHVFSPVQALLLHRIRYAFLAASETTGTVFFASPEEKGENRLIFKGMGRSSLP
jgi:hypothetical protein